MTKRKLGIAVVGLGGAVGTTMTAGIELLKKGLAGTDGLPLANLNVPGLADYTDIVFAGWDMFGEHLAKAAEEHDVLTHKQFVCAEGALREIKPWPAVENPSFLSNIEGGNRLAKSSHRETVEKLRENLREFIKLCGAVVVINLASTEKLVVE